MSIALISVIIPVYNGSDYLADAINSVLRQTYTNIEIIVVNDGSNDNGRTEQIALSFGNKIKYFKKKNGGTASALNYGIQKMNGDYFLWLSHDDLMNEDRVEKQLNALLCNNVRIAVCSGSSFCEAGDIGVSFATLIEEVEVESSIGRIMMEGAVTFCGVLLAKTIFEDYGMFDETLSTTQDVEYLFRIMRKEQIVYTNDILYKRRVHPNQGSQTDEKYIENSANWYISSLCKLTSNEMIALAGSEEAFYYKMICTLHYSHGHESVIQFCMDRIKGNKEKHLNYIKPDGVWIYGAGGYGKQRLFDLRCRGVKIKGFIDKDTKKHGKSIYGIMCHSIDEYDNGKVILAGKMVEKDMISFLKTKHIEDFLTREEYEKKVFGTVPSPGKISSVYHEYKKMYL